MLPRRCKAVGLCRTSLFFAPRTLGTAVTCSVDNATPDHLLPQAATSLQIHCFKRTTALLCRQKEEQLVNIMSMEVVIISKSKYEEMVGKLNRLSDRVNEILHKRGGKTAQPLDGQPRSLPTVAHQSANFADAPRQRYAGLLADRAQDFLQAGGCAAHRPARGGQT